MGQNGGDFFFLFGLDNGRLMLDVRGTEHVITPWSDSLQQRAERRRRNQLYLYFGFSLHREIGLIGVYGVYSPQQQARGVFFSFFGRLFWGDHPSADDLEQQQLTMEVGIVPAIRVLQLSELAQVLVVILLLLLLLLPHSYRSQQAMFLLSDRILNLGNSSASNPFLLLVHSPAQNKTSNPFLHSPAQNKSFCTSSATPNPNRKPPLPPNPLPQNPLPPNPFPQNPLLQNPLPPNPLPQNPLLQNPLHQNLDR